MTTIVNSHSSYRPCVYLSFRWIDYHFLKSIQFHCVFNSFVIQLIKIIEIHISCNNGFFVFGHSWYCHNVKFFFKFNINTLRNAVVYKKFLPTSTTDRVPSVRPFGKLFVRIRSRSNTTVQESNWKFDFLLFLVCLPEIANILVMQ